MMLKFENINEGVFQKSIDLGGNVFLNYLKKCDFNFDVVEGNLRVEGIFLNKNLSDFNEYNIVSVLKFDDFLGYVTKVTSNLDHYKIYQAYGSLGNMTDEVNTMRTKNHQYNKKLNELGMDYFNLEEAIKFFKGS